MSFAFVPRRVTRPGASSRPTVSSAPAHIVTEATQAEAKGKAKEVSDFSEDYAALVQLSLSEYTLWFDSELARSLSDAQNQGFIPLSYLCRHSQYLCSINPPPSEVQIVKAIRAHLDDIFETRILVSAPSKSDWRAPTTYIKKEVVVGGYEIRRRDWETFESKMAQHNKREWDAKTVYVEKIPPHFRTVPAMCRFVGSLLGGLCNVQHITIPPHHLDKSGDLPKPRGFGFFTLLSSETIDSVLADWPWARQFDESRGNPSPSAQEAFKFGFRAISKQRWEELKEEYLVYRETLLEQMDEGEETEPALAPPKPKVEPPAKLVQQPSLVSKRKTHPSSSYPIGCLIFVRNIHSETNKTTLRNLFTSAAGKGPELMDYVDFNKGMDSCFLRVANEGYAEALVNHFITNPVKQAGGLDAAGTPTSTNAITMELVQGVKEELYWNKVPEKVRNQAVQKALQQEVSRPAKKAKR